MSDTSGMPDRADIDQLRQKHLEAVQTAFGKALDVVLDFRELATQYPDDVELRGLIEILSATFKQVLNTVTCKVISNGMAADWDKLLEMSTHGDSDRAGSRNP